MGRISSLNSFPLEFSAAICMFSKSTMSPASLRLSLSCVGAFTFAAATERNVSRSFGITFSVKARLPDGSMVIILKTFCSISVRSSRSFISSSRAGRIFLSKTDLGNWLRIRGNPRMNCDFSFGVFPGSESRKRIVDTKMLSK